MGKASRSRSWGINLATRRGGGGRGCGEEALVAARGEGSAKAAIVETPSPGDYKGSLPATSLLAIIGIIFELLYLFLLALAPLRELHLFPTPLITAWSWTLVPSHLLFPGAWNSAGNPPGGDWPYILLLAIIFLALAGLHLFAIRVIFNRNMHGENYSGFSRWLLLLLLGAAIFGLTLLLQPALFSDDVFRYIFSGRMLTIYHVDPMATAPAQFPYDPYLPWLSQPGTSNVYGPLWLTLISLLTRIAGTPLTTLLLFKAVTLLFHLLNCVLLWAILGRIAPTRRFLGTLLYAWNPLALIEVAGNGHNEAALVFLLLLATWLHVQDKGRWHEIGALALFGLAMTINLIVLLLVVMYTWFIARGYRGIASVTWNASWRLLLVLALVVLLYVPFWHGASTYLAITSSMNMQPVMYSFVNVLATPLRELYNMLVLNSNVHTDLAQPTPAADATVLSTTIFIFALIYFYLLGKVRKAPPTTAGMKYASHANPEMKLPGFDILLDSWGMAIWGYVVLVTGAFWPSFILWALWIVALRRFDALTVSTLLLSYTSLFIYPLLDFGNAPVAVYAPLLIFGIPLVYLLIGRKRRTERNRLSYDR